MVSDFEKQVKQTFQKRRYARALGKVLRLLIIRKIKTRVRNHCRPTAKTVRH